MNQKSPNTVRATYEIRYDKSTKTWTLLEYFGEAYSNILGKYKSLNELVKDLQSDASLLIENQNVELPYKETPNGTLSDPRRR